MNNRGFGLWTQMHKHTHTHTLKNFNDIAKTSLSAELNGCCLTVIIDVNEIDVSKMSNFWGNTSAIR